MEDLAKDRDHRWPLNTALHNERNNLVIRDRDLDYLTVDWLHLVRPRQVSMNCQPAEKGKHHAGTNVLKSLQVRLLAWQAFARVHECTAVPVRTALAKPTGVSNFTSKFAEAVRVVTRALGEGEGACLAAP